MLPLGRLHGKHAVQRGIWVAFFAIRKQHFSLHFTSLCFISHLSASCLKENTHTLLTSLPHHIVYGNLPHKWYTADLSCCATACWSHFHGNQTTHERNNGKNPSSRQRGRYKINPQLPKGNFKEKDKLVAGPRWVPDTKTGWPTDCRS
jgi:hypothetical protein